MRHTGIVDSVALAFANHDAGRAASPVPTRSHRRGHAPPPKTFANLVGPKAELVSAGVSAAWYLVGSQRFADEDGYRNRGQIVKAVNELLEQIGCLGDHELVTVFVKELEQACDVAGIRLLEVCDGVVR